MKTLFKYLKHYTAESILGPLFKMLEALFELFVPLVVSDIIDNGIMVSDKAYITEKFIILVLLSVIGIIFSLTAQYFAAKAAVGCTSKLRYSLFSHIESLSFDDIDKIGIPTLLNRLTSDLNQVQNGINLSLRLLLRSPFVVFGAVIMAFMISPKMSLVFLGAIAVLSVIVFAIMGASVLAYKKVNSALDSLTGRTRENLVGTRVIRAFGMEDYQSEKFDSENTFLSKAQQFAGKISALTNPLTFVVLNIGIIVLIKLSGIEVNSGGITTGQTVALYNYMTQILIELIKLANLIISITKFAASMNRIETVLLTEPTMTYPLEPALEVENAPSVEFRDVTLKYSNGGEAALLNISFKVNAGETVGIIGGTGSGKTSVVRMIPRFYDATSGQVLVDGVDVKDYPAKQLRDKIGYVLQKAVLFGGSIKENLLFGDENADDDTIRSAVRDAQAENVIESKPNEIDSSVEQGGKNFSGGQRQRLSIARALVRRPEILILDDSASALDFATEAALRSAISSLDYKPTTVIVSQRTSSIMKADKIVVLDDGKVAGIGRHRDLLETCEVYREIYDSQFKKA